MPSQPLGLYYIKAYLEKHGYSVTVTDLNVQPLHFGNEKVVGVYVSTFLFNEAKQIIREAKALGKIVVAGGVHVWSDPDSLRKIGVDYLVQGDGEISMLKIMQQLDETNYAEPEPNTPVFNNPVEDLDSLPIPKRVKYPTSPVLSTSRGCLFKCSFCSTGHIGKLIRYHSPERVIEEMSSLRGQDIAILDDLFTADLKRLVTIQKMMQKERLDVSITIGNGTRIDLADRERLKTLKRMNLQKICYGVESIDDDVLRACNKKTTFEKIDATIKRTKRMSIPLTVFMIIGLPRDTLHKTIRAAKWVEKEGLAAFWNVATPYPRTAFYDWVNRHGRWLIDAKDYSNYGGHFGKALKVVFDTENFPLQQRLAVAERLSVDSYPLYKRAATVLLGKIGKSKREMLAWAEQSIPTPVCHVLFGSGQGEYIKKEARK